MNREIKFRAWITNENGDKQMTYDLAFERYAPINELLNDCTVMLFTGFKDRNGIDIYSGDILATCFNNQTGTTIISEKGYPVEFKNGAFMWNGELLGYEIEDNQLLELNPNKWSTIIGNIYENANLLT